MSKVKTPYLLALLNPRDKRSDIFCRFVMILPALLKSSIKCKLQILFATFVMYTCRCRVIYMTFTRLNVLLNAWAPCTRFPKELVTSKTCHLDLRTYKSLFVCLVIFLVTILWIIRDHMDDAHIVFKLKLIIKWLSLHDVWIFMLWI